jgi:iron complex transport system permease protein
MGLILTALLICLGLLLFGGAETLSFQAIKEHSVTNNIDSRIFWLLRFPRLLLVLTVGGALAMLGGTYQILFNNPLADPYILGISSSVTLGLVVAELFLGWPSNSLKAMGVGLGFALVVISLLLFCFYWQKMRSMERVVLFGVGVNFLFSSALFILISLQNHSLGSGSMRWLFGNIPWVDLKESFALISIVAPIGIIILILGRYLDGLSLGDTVARTLGFNPNHVRGFYLVLTSLLLTSITCLTGSIGFIGLVVPHCVRLVFAPRSARVLLLISFVFGALFLAISDSIARSILPPMEFPIGMVTTLLGGPLFLYLLWKR